MGVGVEPLDREESTIGQRCIQRRGSVTFAQNEAVTVRVIRILHINIQRSPVSCYQNIDTRKRGAEVRGSCHVRQFNDFASDLARNALQISCTLIRRLSHQLSFTACILLML